MEAILNSIKRKTKHNIRVTEDTKSIRIMELKSKHKGEWLEVMEGNNT